MKKKILIVSIIAVAILVGVSLTSVVGYQSVESNFKESPLFNVRSERAIEKEGSDVICDYVGKGEETYILVPNRIDGISSFQKLINLITKISDRVDNPNINNILQAFQNDLIDDELIPDLNDLINQHDKDSDILNILFNPEASTNPPTGCCLTTEPPILCKILAIIFIILVALGIA